VRKRWLLEVNGRPCRLDAEWDLVITSRGAAWVDGVQVARWWPGTKMPGITATVPVHGLSVCLVALTMDFDIDLSRSPGVLCLDPPLAPDYSPSARVQMHLKVMWLVLALVLGLPLVIVLFAIVLAVVVGH
jgi:hypothetical protein